MNLYYYGGPRDPDTLLFSVSRSAPYGLGTTTVSLTVEDKAAGIEEACDDASIKVLLLVQPICNNVVVTANSSCLGSVTDVKELYGGTCVDDNLLAFIVSESGPFPVGTSNVQLTIIDGWGEQKDAMLSSP